MKILFLHGWHSTVGGIKPTYLKNAGHEVINPALDDDDFELAIRTAQAEYDQHQPDVIVGSSRGGAAGRCWAEAICKSFKSVGSQPGLLNRRLELRLDQRTFERQSLKTLKSKDPPSSRCREVKSLLVIHPLVGSGTGI